MNLKEHLQENGKTASWIDLANQFNVTGTNKQKSDYVRRLYRQISKPSANLHKMAVEYNQQPEYYGYCQALDSNGQPFPNPEYTLTSSSTGNPLYINLNGPSDYPFGPKIGDYPPYNINIPNPLKTINDLPWNGTLIDRQKKDWEEFNKWKASKEPKKKVLQPYLSGNINNVLFIGDLHLPFTAEGYLEFCRNQQERFNCGTVIYAGDLLDNHAQSFHNSDADGLSAKDELNLAIKQLEEWYRVFPKAIVLLGNHDRIVARKLFSVGVSQRWMKPLGEVLNTPNYTYVEQHIFNDVLYVHGEGGTALKKAQNELISVACGHSHTEGYVQFINGGKNFAMQVGCGIDFKSYAFAYAQRGKLPVLSCGVVLNQSPILIPFV